VSTSTHGVELRAGPDPRWAWLLVPLAVRPLWFAYVLSRCHLPGTAAWHCVYDVRVWLRTIAQMHDGSWPLIDFRYDYPPGAILLHSPLLLLPEPTEHTFLMVYGLGAWAVELLTAAVFCAILEHHGVSVPRRIAALFALLALPTSICLAPFRFDGVPILLVLVAYLAWQKGQWRMCGLCLGVGTTIKLFPALLAVSLGLYLLRQRRLRQLAAMASWVALPILIVELGYQLALEARGADRLFWLRAYTWTFDATPRMDTWQGIAAHHLGWHFGQAPACLALAMLLAALFLHDHREVLGKYVLLCLALLIPSRVYSSQYQLWFAVPALLIAVRNRAGPLLALVFAAEIANVLIYPILFTAVSAERAGHSAPSSLAEPMFATLIVVRTLLLCGIGYCIARAPDRSRSG
jgi:hypothetical protein